MSLWVGLVFNCQLVTEYNAEIMRGRKTKGRIQKNLGV